jgi:hypothetical protein
MRGIINMQNPLERDEKDGYFISFSAVVRGRAQAYAANCPCLFHGFSTECLLTAGSNRTP